MRCADALVDLGRAGEDGPVERAAEHRRIAAGSSASSWPAWTATFSAGATGRQGRERYAPRSPRPAGRAPRSAAGRSRCRRRRRRRAARRCGLRSSAAWLTKNDGAEHDQGREQEEDEAARIDGGDEIAPRDHPGGLEQAHHAASPSVARCLHLARGLLAGDGDEGVVQAAAARSTAPRSRRRRRSAP